MIRNVCSIWHLHNLWKMHQASAMLLSNASFFFVSGFNRFNYKQDFKINIQHRNCGIGSVPKFLIQRKNMNIWHATSTCKKEKKLCSILTWITQFFSRVFSWVWKQFSLFLSLLCSEKCFQVETCCKTPQNI